MGSFYLNTSIFLTLKNNCWSCSVSLRNYCLGKCRPIEIILQGCRAPLGAVGVPHPSFWGSTSPHPSCWGSIFPLLQLPQLFWLLELWSPSLGRAPKQHPSVPAGIPKEYAEFTGGKNAYCSRKSILSLFTYDLVRISPGISIFISPHFIHTMNSFDCLKEECCCSEFTRGTWRCPPSCAPSF